MTTETNLRDGITVEAYHGSRCRGGDNFKVPALAVIESDGRSLNQPQMKGLPQLFGLRGSDGGIQGK